MSSKTTRMDLDTSQLTGPTLLLDETMQSASRIENLLRDAGHQVTVVQSVTEAEAALAKSPHGLVVVAETSLESNLDPVFSVSARHNLPVLIITQGVPSSSSAMNRLKAADDWIASSSVDAELVLRIAHRLNRNFRRSTAKSAGSGMPIDSESFALIVHDLRTPLNVVYLTLLMLRQGDPKNDPQFAQDLMLVEGNFRQLERMLTMLTEYFRLHESKGALAPHEFSPRRLVDELLEERSAKAGLKMSPVVVDIEDSCPQVVALDRMKATTAISYALLNASSAASGQPIRLVMRGGSDRWVIEIAVDQPAPPTFRAAALSSDSYERLCGVAAERRGMDLAIASKVSELFGGSARLELLQSPGTAVVLDWPSRLPESVPVPN